MTRAGIVAALYETLAANGIEDGVHLRLRGLCDALKEREAR